ncbi:hypothetical protein Y032_0080g1329 [Ancylostoma ceylanicum]|uniref:Uncharacterized protein n=1 Tax=Ancylostoma ceylanicum TaxID=53326 RepID=A0A016TSU5_9BILA|nr:hypothetical protein Y032_0080g1329 [Ancylostoma ceylanicum]
MFSGTAPAVTHGSSNIYVNFNSFNNVMPVAAMNGHHQPLDLQSIARELPRLSNEGTPSGANPTLSVTTPMETLEREDARRSEGGQSEMEESSVPENGEDEAVQAAEEGSANPNDQNQDEPEGKFKEVNLEEVYSELVNAFQNNTNKHYANFLKEFVDKFCEKRYDKDDWKSLGVEKDKTVAHMVYIEHGKVIDFIMATYKAAGLNVGDFFRREITKELINIVDNFRGRAQYSERRTERSKVAPTETAQPPPE